MEFCLRAFWGVLSFFPVFGAIAQNTSSATSDSIGIFLKGDTVVISDIIIEGNKTTKNQIILRELVFHIGDTLDPEVFYLKSEISRDYLINLFLFNDVIITPEIINMPYIKVTVQVIEKMFYIVPLPVFELADRNFNQWWLSKDFSRTNYGFYLTWYNMRGRNETLKATLIQGYTKKYELGYFFPFINKRQTIGLGFNAGFTRNREIWFETRDNKLRFYEGVGEPMYKKFNAGITLNIRSRFLKTNKFEFLYNHISIGDTIAKELNPSFLLNGTRQEEISIKFTHINDHRVQKGYPLEGYYYKIETTNTLIDIKNPRNLLVFRGTVKKYTKIAHRTYVAMSLITKISSLSRQPYYNFKALGYDDFVRGYELFVIDGQHFTLFKTAVKYAVIPSRFYKVKFGSRWNSNALFATYLNVFLDAGYVRNQNTIPGNTLTNSLLLGYGIGLNLVYSHNNVFRLEFTGNKQGNSGVFLHFVYAI